MDIIESTGDLVRFGIRVKIFAYPENIVSTWIMISVKFRMI